MDILFEKVYTLVTITPQGVRRKLEVQDMGLNLSGMTTETRNPRTMQLDQMSPRGQAVGFYACGRCSQVPAADRAGGDMGGRIL